METHQIIIILSLIVVIFLLFKAFKAIITFCGVLFLLSVFAFFLRSQNIVSFDIPEDLDFKNFNFSINKDLLKDENNEKSKEHKKTSIEDIKNQEKLEEENIKENK